VARIVLKSEDPMSTPTPAPWLDSDAARTIGPVEYVSDLSPEGRRRVETQVRLWGGLAQLCRVALIAGIVGLVATWLLSDFLPAYWGAPLCAGLSFLALIVGWVGSGIAARGLFQHQTTLASRLLVGARGFALWAPRGAIVLSWAQFTPSLFPDPNDPGRKRGFLSLRRTLYLAELYEHTERVEERGRAELQRRAEELAPAPATPSPPEHPKEPWLDSEAARLIGPVEMVAAPNPEIARRRRGARRVAQVLAGLVVVAIPTGFLLPLVFPTVRWPDPVLVLIGAIAVGLLGVSFVGAIARHAWLLDTRILVGPRGLAVWGPHGSLVIPWEELGVFWDVSAKIAPEEPTGAVHRALLRFRRRDGACFYLTDLFDDAERIQERVLAELHRRTGPVPPESGVVEPGA
jgi:hypothetical protein